MPFQCSICGEESTRICALCTKDACNNHLHEKCGRCSDCCECEIALIEEPRVPAWGSARAAVRAAAESKAPEAESTPLPPIPDPVAEAARANPPEAPQPPESDAALAPDQEPDPGPVEA